jgi:ligand-binding sensor domain-containing protein
VEQEVGGSSPPNCTRALPDGFRRNNRLNSIGCFAHSGFAVILINRDPVQIADKRTIFRQWADSMKAYSLVFPETTYPFDASLNMLGDR